MNGVLRVGGGSSEESLVEFDSGVVEDELCHGGEVATRLVEDGLVLVVSGEEEEGGESANVVGGVDVVLGGVDLGDDDGLDLGEGGGELLVEGSESLAVTAPGRVELHEDVLLGVLDDLVEVLVDEGAHIGLLIGLRDGLRALERIASARRAASDELDGGLRAEVLLLVERVEGGLVVLPGGEDHGGVLRAGASPLCGEVGVRIDGGL